jgi:hypothetical protein
MDPETAGLIFENRVDDILAKIEVRPTDLHSRKWSSLESPIQKKRISPTDQEAFHKFYTDTMQTVSTTSLE